MTDHAISDYQVVLDTFRGPLDLLLYLVKRDEIDILDIPIARVAEQFKHYIDVLKLIDVEGAGDFLVMAATLMEIKSRMLLPREEETTETVEDPRRELVKQLLQYKRIKEAAGLLDERAAEQMLRMPRVPVPTPTTKSGPPSLQPVELWDLVSAFGRLMRETLTSQPQSIVVDHTPLHVHMDYVLECVQRQGQVTFSSLFIPPHTRSRLVGLFLAVLELAKIHKVVPEQNDPHGDIYVRLAPPEEATSSPEESRQAA